MGLRIHLTPDDLKRVTVSRAPAPLWETALSLRTLQSPGWGGPLAGWQRWARGRAPRATRLLRGLVPPSGYSPDLLTPADTGLSLEAGIDAVLSTPRARIRTEAGLLLRSTEGSGFPASVARDLLDGGNQSLAAMGAALRSYHEAVIAPLNGHVHTAFDQALAGSMDRLLTGGLEALLGGLHPRISWCSPVLELDRPGQDDDVYLDGCGVHLLPSFFCADIPTVYQDTSLPYTIVVPIEHPTGWQPPVRSDSGQDGLAPLLGLTRARVLRTIVAERVRGTTDLAGHLGISPATVSHHVAALRTAGLVRTERTGTGVSHRPTPLGHRLALA